MHKRFLLLALLIFTLIGALSSSAFDVIDQFPRFSSRLVTTYATLRVVFDEPVDPATVNDASFSVQDLRTDAMVAGSRAVETTHATNDTVVFTPDVRWAWGRRHQLTVTAALQSA